MAGVSREKGTAEENPRSWLLEVLNLCQPGKTGERGLGGITRNECLGAGVLALAKTLSDEAGQGKRVF